MMKAFKNYQSAIYLTVLQTYSWINESICISIYFEFKTCMLMLNDNSDNYITIDWQYYWSDCNMSFQKLQTSNCQYSGLKQDTEPGLISSVMA